MTFREYIKSQPITSDPLGDFVGDVKDDREFPDVANRAELVSYLHGRGACSAAVRTGEAWWGRYLVAGGVVALDVQRRSAAPVEHDSAPVKMRGEVLGEVWWRGRQWAVTDYGIEALNGCYNFEWKRMLDRVDIHGWPEHMSGKNWVDIDDFITAWLVGVALHSKHSDSLRRCIGRSYVRPEVDG